MCILRDTVASRLPPAALLGYDGNLRAFPYRQASQTTQCKGETPRYDVSRLKRKYARSLRSLALSSKSLRESGGSRSVGFRRGDWAAHGRFPAVWIQHTHGSFPALYIP
eukprot:8122262-Pyramimonas_sp.AAC.1